jgi:hypothetical protein
VGIVGVASADEKADELYPKAMQQYVQGNYSVARELARRAVEKGNAKAWRLVGASSCFMRDGATAREALEHAAQWDRQFTKYVCGRNCINAETGEVLDPCPAVQEREREQAHEAALKQAKAAFAQAQQAFSDGKWSEAREAARRSLAIHVDRDASKIVGVASCVLKDRAGAVEALPKLDTLDQRFVRHACAQSGVALPE